MPVASAQVAAPVPAAPSEFTDALSGDDMGRLIGLTDGMFGFAITLLVTTLVVPKECLGLAVQEPCLAGDLWTEGYLVLAYLFSFAVLGIWWIRHHMLFRYIGRYDAALLWGNLVFLITIGITPFILGVFANYTGVEVAVVLFALVQAAAGGMLLVLLEIAVRADLLKPGVPPPFLARFRRRLYITPLIFLISAGVALISVYAAHIIWAGIFIEIIWTQLSATRLRSSPSKPQAQ